MLRARRRRPRPRAVRRFLRHRRGSPDGRVVVVCAGDSITHGVMSADYVGLLRHELGPAYQVVNAGVDGDLAFNLEQRLDAIIDCRPDVVTVLIGTNDAAAHINDAWRRQYVRNKHLPEQPTLEWYRAMLERIVDRLQGETSAAVALLDLPILGEDLSSVHNRRVADFNAEIAGVGAAAGVPVLPLHERLVALLPEAGRAPVLDGSRGLMLRAIVGRFLLRRSWDEVGRRQGFSLLTDQVHLGDRAAREVAGLVGDFVRSR